MRRCIIILALAALMLPAMHATASEGDDDWEPVNTITWSLAESPVVLNESIEIAEDTRLVIEAGVAVRLDHKVGIQVKGHLDIRGSPGSPVTFTSNGTGPPGPDSWESVRLLSESRGRLHQVESALFEGARTGLQVSSTSALVQDCAFVNNRYGIVARGGAHVEARRCDFVNNSALGLEWEQGSTGLAVDCTFLNNVVGAYWYKSSEPVVVSSQFEGNYHHVSFAGGSNGTVRSCTFTNAVAEAFECYDSSSPLLDDVTVEGQEGDGIHIRNASRPRMVGGTPVSSLVVDSKDNASYVIALTRITVEVRGDDGKRLAGANVTLSGASGMVFTEGVTDSQGRLGGAMMSIYTAGTAGGQDRENPHQVMVAWRGHEETFTVDPRDLDNDKVLKLEMDTETPEPGGWGFIPNVVVLLVIAVAVIIIAFLYQRRR